MTAEAAVLLLIAVTIVIQTVLPVGAYLALRKQSSLSGRIWLVAMSCWFVAGTLTALRPWLDRYWGYELVWFFLSLTYLFMIVYFRWQLRPNQRIEPRIWILVGLLFALSGLSVMLAWPVHYGYVWVSALIPLGTAYLFGLVWQIRLQHRRKSLVLMLLVFAAFGLSSLPRLLVFMVSGQPEQMDLFRFGWVANVFTLVAIVGPIFLSLAHWMYVLEKSNDESFRAKQLLASRDQMLLDGAGVSGQSMLSSFAAMVVHEFGSLLQSLRLNVGRLREQSAQISANMEWVKPLERLDDSTREASELLKTLRALMLSTEPTAEVFALRDCLADVIAIARTEAKAKGISLDLDFRLPQDQQVTANAVMLQRVLLNVLKNSFESLATSPVEGPVVRVTVKRRWRERSQRHCMVIEIQDNGRGYPEELLGSLGQPWQSQKPAGMGLGLLLSKNLLELWGGDLEIGNLPPPQTGAWTLIWVRCDERQPQTDSTALGSADR
jgi:signal transduction histidine kinase